MTEHYFSQYIPSRDEFLRLFHMEEMDQMIIDAQYGRFTRIFEERLLVEILLLLSEEGQDALESHIARSQTEEDVVNFLREKIGRFDQAVEEIRAYILDEYASPFLS